MKLITLHPDRDEALYREAWSWREFYPRLVRTWDMVKTFDQWFGMMQRRVSIGMFNPELSALITLEPMGSDVYEVHVDCDRGVNRTDLLTALLSIRKQLFEEWGAAEVFAGVIARNRGIVSIARLCGFTPDGIEQQVGKLRFIRLRITKDVFNQDQHQHWNSIGSIRPSEPLRPDARCVVA